MPLNQQKKHTQYQAPSIFGQGGMVEVDDKNPSYKGQPYLVVGVAGPMIATNFCLEDGIIIFDSRFVEFVEVDETFTIPFSVESAKREKERTVRC